MSFGNCLPEQRTSMKRHWEHVIQTGVRTILQTVDSFVLGIAHKDSSASVFLPSIHPVSGTGFFGRFTLTLNALKLQEQSQQLLCGLHALVSFIHPPTPYSDRTLCKRITQYPNKCGEQVLCKPRNPGGVCIFGFLWYVSSKNSK